jgi:hypothetical protein
MLTSLKQLQMFMVNSKILIYIYIYNNSVELALANLDLNELVLDPITFDDGDPLEGSSSRVHINKCTD